MLILPTDPIEKIISVTRSQEDYVNSCQFSNFFEASVLLTSKGELFIGKYDETENGYLTEVSQTIPSGGRVFRSCYGK